VNNRLRDAQRLAARLPDVEKLGIVAQRRCGARAQIRLAGV
jgi:hypothetical protein